MGNKIDWNLVIVIVLLALFILAMIVIIQYQEAKAHEVVAMSIRDRLEVALIKWETGNTPLERLLTVARDGKENLVVGVGHDVMPRDNLEFGDRITINEMNIFLQQDLDKALESAYSLLDNARNYPQDVKMVLAAMCYQLGKKGTSKFKKMLAAIKVRDYATAADEMLKSEWANQTTRRAQAMASIMRGVADE